MKRLTTIIVKNGKKQAISVLVDNETARILKSVDEATLHQYICDEYKYYLLERKEKRRHQSLDASLENGFDIVDETYNPEEVTIENSSKEILHYALKMLKPEQQWLINQVFFLGRKQTEIAKELCVDKTSIRDRLQTIYENLKKYF